MYKFHIVKNIYIIYIGHFVKVASMEKRQLEYVVSFVILGRFVNSQ